MRFFIILVFLLLVSCDEEIEPVAPEKERSIPAVNEGATDPKPRPTYSVEGDGWHVWDEEFLVPEFVGVWEDPDLMGQGKEVFALSRGEEVEILHWMRNQGGFPVFRIRSKDREGWILGIYLRDSNDQGPKAQGEK